MIKISTSKQSLFINGFIVVKQIMFNKDIYSQNKRKFLFFTIKIKLKNLMCSLVFSQL
jgi:hypothetical protein